MDVEQQLRRSMILRDQIKELLDRDNNVNAPTLLALRYQYKDLLQQILLENISFAMKHRVDMQLWNHGFYCHIAKLKKKGRALEVENTESREDKAKVQQALASVRYQLLNFAQSSIAFYVQFIRELVSQYGIQDKNILNSSRSLEEIRSATATTDEQEQCIECCQRSLLFVGDLLRYEAEVHSNMNDKLDAASAYYKQALRLHPTNGMPHNQLAIIATHKEDFLGACYGYIRAMYSRDPAPRAALNLQTLFSSIIKRDPRKQSQDEDGKRTLNSITWLLGNLLTNCQWDQVDFEDARSETMDALSQFLAEYKSITPNMPANLLLQVVCAFLHAIQSSRNIEDSGFDQGATPRMAKTRSIVLLLDLLLVLSNGVILLQNRATYENVVGSLKILTNWLRGHPEIWLHVSETNSIPPFVASHSAWETVASVLNKISTAGNSTAIDENIEAAPEYGQPGLLLEDEELIGCTLVMVPDNLEPISGTSDFNNEIRARCLIGFGLWASSIHVNDRERLLYVERLESARELQAFGMPSRDGVNWHFSGTRPQHFSEQDTHGLMFLSAEASSFVPTNSPHELHIDISASHDNRTREVDSSLPNLESDSDEIEDEVIVFAGNSGQEQSAINQLEQDTQVEVPSSTRPEDPSLLEATPALPLQNKSESIDEISSLLSTNWNVSVVEGSTNESYATHSRSMSAESDQSGVWGTGTGFSQTSEDNVRSPVTAWSGGLRDGDMAMSKAQEAWSRFAKSPDTNSPWGQDFSGIQGWPVNLGAEPEASLLSYAPNTTTNGPEIPSPNDTMSVNATTPHLPSKDTH
eukprot:m.112375 g.112375  ORF g.112375 m.112375 type:complete len:809 (+) comp14088_c0_seq5:167-2593(+)